MENLRSRIDVKLVSNERDNLKWTSKTSYISYKIFDKDLVTIGERNLALMFNKPV